MNISREGLDRWAWPGVIGGSAVLTSTMVLLDIASPVRHVLVIWFLLVCPGMAFVRLLSLRNSLAEWTLAVALSFVLTSGIAMGMVYAGQWWPERGFLALVAITLLGVVLLIQQAQRNGGRTGMEETGEQAAAQDVAA